MPPETLVYAFKPYGEFSDNISEAIVNSLSTDDNLTTQVFDVQFSRSMFLSTLKNNIPDIIIGLGQNPRARKLQLERKALNLWSNKGKFPQPIDRNGRPHLFVNLRLPRTLNTTVTYNAGTYVCNFSMYVFLNYCLNNGSKFAFIHVPVNFNVQAAADFVMHAIQFGNEKVSNSSDLKFERAIKPL